MHTPTCTIDIEEDLKRQRAYRPHISIDCVCERWERIGMYYDPEGAITYHVEPAGRQPTVYPLHRQFLPEGDYDLQSVDSELLVTYDERKRMGIERMIHRIYPDAKIIWEQPDRHLASYTPVEKPQENRKRRRRKTP